MMKVQDGNSFNVPIPTYYIESESELNDIPSNAPAGTIVEVNAPEANGGFKVFMKHSSGTFNEL